MHPFARIFEFLGNGILVTSRALRPVVGTYRKRTTLQAIVEMPVYPPAVPKPGATATAGAAKWYCRYMRNFFQRFRF
jgi:hypothetical protein